MRRIMCQELTFFFLAVLLLVICGSCSAVQYMDAAAPQMGEASGPQFGGNSPSQTVSASESQAGGNSGSQAGSNSGSQAGGNSGYQAGGNSGPQAGGSSGSQADRPSTSQMGERSRSQMGGTNSPSLNASSGSRDPGAQATANGTGRGNADVDVQNWRGTATKDGESHPIRLNVETILTLDADVARNLLSSNLSLEDIRFRLRTGNRDTILRGSLRISNDSYRLVNITVESSANQSALGARLAGPRAISDSGDEAEIVGHISVVISADDLEVARGYAVIDDSRYSGTYSIELNRQSGRAHMWGMPGRES